MCLVLNSCYIPYKSVEINNLFDIIKNIDINIYHSRTACSDCSYKGKCEWWWNLPTNVFICYLCSDDWEKAYKKDVEELGLVPLSDDWNNYYTEHFGGFQADSF